MLTVNKLVPQGRGLAPVLLKRASRVALDWDVRCKSRFDATDSTGRLLGVFLPRGQVVRGGDVLVAEDGSLVRVLAALQPVMEVRPGDESGTPRDLPRAAYHLGNRHVAVEVQADHLKIEPDHVLAQMLRQLGLIVAETQAAFEPEGGAYGAEAAGHGHDHAHGHGPAPAAQPVRGKPVPVAVGAAPAPHVHGPGCGHDHGHDHKHKP